MRLLKDNRFVRGLWFLYKSYFGFRRTMGHVGGNVIITPPYLIDNQANVHIGNNVGIGARCVISATRARFVCKDNCAIAEDFTVHTGNHARVIGRFVTDIGDEEKPGEYDKEVTVEEDVWIGCRVTLLSGVTVGRGSTVAAGAVVTKPLPPYCVAGGVPAKVIRFKWTVDEILRHEGMLYPEEERLSRAELEDIFNKYSKKE